MIIRKAFSEKIRDCAVQKDKYQEKKDECVPTNHIDFSSCAIYFPDSRTCVQEISGNFVIYLNILIFVSISCLYFYIKENEINILQHENGSLFKP